MKILYTSAEVRHEVIRLFSSHRRRRIAIVAFVGDGAEVYLQNPKCLHVICWPKAGGTNPHEIRQLLHRGVRVSFCDSLHMKLYWAEGRGAIITSANLSTNALGSGDLREFGVLVPANKVNIKKVLDSLELREPSKRELQELDRQHDLYHKNQRFFKRSPIETFDKWFRTYEPRQWKLGWSDGYCNFSTEAIAIAERDFGLKPHWFISCRNKDYRKGDWVLNFELRGNKATEFAWVFVDYIAHVKKSEKKAYSPDYPFQAVQVGKLNRYPIPPFAIDPAFRKSFNETIREFGGGERIKAIKSVKPPRRFVELIYKHYA